MKDSKPCTCQTCKDMCQRPCWPTPEEAQKLIDAGYGDRLMLDYWVRQGGDIYILSPALKGYEGDTAPFWPTGRCTFQDSQGLCMLHDQGLKPLEGRVIICTEEQPNLHRDISKMWDNKKGRKVVKEWNSRR